MNVQFCWIVRHDLPAILEIERASYAFPWSEAEFLDALLERGCIGVVARSRRQVAGLLLYQAHSRCIEIVNLAVAVELRRSGIGRQMIDFLKEKLSHDGRCDLSACVSDDSLGAQLFLRDQGFRAVTVLRDFYDEHDGDAYVMKYELDDRRFAFRRNDRVSRHFDIEA